MLGWQEASLIGTSKWQKLTLDEGVVQILAACRPKNDWYFTDFGTLLALFSDQFTFSSALPELVSSCMKVLRLLLSVQKCILWSLDANNMTLVANC